MTTNARHAAPPPGAQQKALEPLSDFDLVRRVRESGDAAAFELIMRRHNQRLYRLARGILRNASDAEDIVQETYVTAFGKLASFVGPDGFPSWLARIAINYAYRRLERRGKVVLFEDYTTARRADGDPVDDPLSALVSEEPTPHMAAETRELRGLLERSIDALPPEFRVVFVLAHVEGCSIREIADILSLNEQTVKTRAHRARQRLQKSLGRAFSDLVPSVHVFDGERCDRIVSRVLERVTR